MYASETFHQGSYEWWVYSEIRLQCRVVFILKMLLFLQNCIYIIVIDMANIIRLFIVIAAVLGITSCTTYLIPIESFKQQFSDVDSSEYVNVKVRGPIGEGYYYAANPIGTIKCVDKEGKPHILKNSPSIEIRFTYGDRNKRTVFYFDRIFVNDSCVVGVRSRFIPSLIKTIPINSIKKIEIQDGRKNFKYQ